MSTNEPALTDKQARFVEEYCVDFNATQAAIRAGYSDVTARSIGHENLTKPDISAAIKKRLEELSLSVEAAVKQISDIASTRINDYMTTRKVVRTQRVRRPLSEVIAALQEEIDFEEEYARRVALDEDELKSHSKSQARRRRELVRLQLELERNPDAVKFVDGPEEEVEEARLDLVALANAKERGRIKALSFTEFGPKVELESPLAALSKILEVHGKIIQKHNHSFEGLDNLSPEQLEQLRILQESIQPQ